MEKARGTTIVMKIMFQIYSFHMGGIERLLLDMSHAMVQRGHSVSVCIINHDYTDSLLNSFDPSVSVILLNRRPGSSLLPYMKQFASIIAKMDIDILHCQGINCVIFSSIAKLRNPRMKVLNTVHDTGNYPSYSNSKIFLQNLFLDETIAISQSVEREILARHISPDHVTLIYNGVDTHHFTCAENITLKMRSRILSSDSVIEICNVARFFPSKKGQDLLVAAIRQLIPEFPNIHCTFAGDIFKGQDKAYADLIHSIQEQGIESHFTFLGNVEDVPSLLHKMDIFVLPSRYEGFGISLIEAMSCGLPCIASNLSGPAEIIQDSSLGFLFDPGSLRDLTEKLRLLIRHYHSFNPHHISNYIQCNFSMDHMVDEHLALYQRLLH